MQDEVKKKYLAVYDYGTGSVWCNIYARSKEEILKKYPALEVPEDQNQDPFGPEFAIERVNWERTMTFDIDDEPKGFLKALARSQ